MDHIGKILHPFDLLEDALKVQGEHHVRLVVRYFLAVCECTYNNYVRIVWELVCVIDKKYRINSSVKFRWLVKATYSRLKRRD